MTAESEKALRFLNKELKIIMFSCKKKANDVTGTGLVF